MLLLQHILCAFYVKPDLTNTEFLAGVMYPDAIRGFSVPRQCSHFETTDNDISYFVYPKSMKTIQENIKEKERYLANHKSCAIGDETTIEKFEELNEILPKEMYRGILTHLIQDNIFDKFVREEIDCSRKYKDKFVINGKELDGKQVRKMIEKMEQFGIYILAYKLHLKYGILITQDWCDEHIYPIMQEEFPKELVEKTYPYIKIDEKINEWIKENNWSHLNDGPVNKKTIENMYEEICRKLTAKD